MSAQLPADLYDGSGLWQLSPSVSLIDLDLRTVKTLSSEQVSAGHRTL